MIYATHPQMVQKIINVFGFGEREMCVWEREGRERGNRYANLKKCKKNLVNLGRVWKLFVFLQFVIKFEIISELKVKENQPNKKSSFIKTKQNHDEWFYMMDD